MINIKPKARPSLKTPSNIEEIIRTIIFVVVVTVLFDMTIPRSLVDGSSMDPTFADRERLIVSRVHYFAQTPTRGDIVVFNAVQSRNTDDMLIKRVIGVPGDTVEFRESALYINGQPVDEPYLNDVDCRFNCADRQWEIGADEYFVMGDNRNHSRDSRSFGAVPIDHIVGRVIFRYWPIPRIGLLDAPQYD